MIIPQRSFSSGELSPSLYARTDYFRYATGAKIMRNVTVKKGGGAENRGGSKYICEVGQNSLAVRKIPFIFNSTQTYSLEFQNLKMRVVKNGVLQTLASQSITSISQANPAVVTYGGADNYPTGTPILISGFNLLDYPGGAYYNNRTFVTSGTNAGANTFNLTYPTGSNVNSTGFGAALTGTLAAIYELTTTYATADLPNLKFSQSGDKMLIVHPSYPPRELVRISDTSWTITDVSFVPTQATATSASATPTGVTGATSYSYQVTAVNDTTGEESLPTAVFTTTTGNATLDSSNYNLIGYTVATGATYYNIYKLRNGAYGFIGVSAAGTFKDIGYTADTSDTPPIARTPFSGANNYPSCVGFYQQRAGYGNTNTNTELVELSQTSAFKNFTKANPIRDSDVVSFSAIGNQINSVNHLLDLGILALFNDTGEKVAQGDSAGVITPSQVNLKQVSYNGSAINPAPIIIDNTALYVQKGGAIIRDFSADYAVDGYKGNDLTNFNDHLFRGRTVVDWAYQKLPDSIVWVVLDDGTLLSLTYIKEQQMLAWTRHDFSGGFVENVNCIPNGTAYDVYIVVKRTIKSGTLYGGIKRYIEKLTNREITLRKARSIKTYYDSTPLTENRYYPNVHEKIFVDCSLTVDGTNATVTDTILISTTGGTGGYTADDIVRANLPSSVFTTASVGNEIHIRDSSGDLYTLEITEYISALAVYARPSRTLPANLQSPNQTSDWSIAVKAVTGLWHLEGLNVAVQGDGFVVANPNNSKFDVITVTNGAIALPACYAVIHVGLPYVSDIETLSIDTATPGTSVDKKALIKTVTIQVENTRGVWAGSRNPEEDKTNTAASLTYGLNEFKTKDFEDYDSDADLLKGKMDLIINSKWNSNGRVFLRQIDPLPMTILSICPEGILPVK